MNTPNAEDLVIEFESDTGKKYIMCYGLNMWIIKKLTIFGWNVFKTFKTLREAEACAEALKKSV